MLKLGFENQSQKRSQGLTFSPLPETRSGKLLPLAISLFFIFFLLSALPVFAASVTLTWDAPTTNSDTTPLTDLSGYRVYMSTTSGQYNSGNIVKNNIPASSSTGGVTETTTVDNLPNGTYYFAVTAYDIYGNESSYSNEILKTTTGGGDTQAPTLPTGLSAQAVSSSQINLSWTASTDNVGVTGYRIYRCTGSSCTPSTQIATSTTNSYSNTGLSASTTYTYAVSAYDAAGNVSAQSTSASATTSSGGGGDTQAPTVPNGLSGQAISSSQINLSWTASTDNVGVTGYRIYRCTSSSCTPSTQIATSATNSYSNTGLSASTAYTYAVSAYDAAGNVSSQSTSVSATTSSSTSTTTLNNSGDSEISGGGCGFVKDNNGKGPKAKGQGLTFAMMLIITLAGIATARRLSLLKTAQHIKPSNN